MTLEVPQSSAAWRAAKMIEKVKSMSFFYRTPYQSEVTRFIDSLKARDPELESKQRQGRELLWDKVLGRSAQGEYRKGGVAQKPYVYQTDSNQV